MGGMGGEQFNSLFTHIHEIDTLFAMLLVPASQVKKESLCRIQEKLKYQANVKSLWL